MTSSTRARLPASRLVFSLRAELCYLLFTYFFNELRDSMIREKTIMADNDDDGIQMLSSRTIRITRTATGASSRRNDDSYWDDADVGGSGYIGSDARWADVPMAKRRSWTQDSAPSISSPDGDGGRSTLPRNFVSIFSGRHEISLLNAALKSALLGAAAALGWHLASIATKILVAKIEHHLQGRGRREGSVVGYSASNAATDADMSASASENTGADVLARRYATKFNDLADQIVRRLQSGATKLTRQIRAKLRQLKGTWPLLIVAASWPYLLRRNRPACDERYGRGGGLRLVLGPLALLWVIGGGDDGDGTDGDEDGGDESGSSGRQAQNASDGPMSRTTTSSVRSPTVRSHPTTTTTPARNMSDLNLASEDNDNDRIRSDSIATPTSTAARTTSPTIPPQRYLEMLVHNVSHTDLVLGIGQKRRGREQPTSSQGGMMALVTPKPKSSATADINTEEQSRRAEMVRMSAEDSKGYLPAAAATATSTSPILDSVEHQHHDEDQLHLDKYALCRPRFSAFDLFTRRILDSMRSSLLLGRDISKDVVSFPRYERSDVTSRYNLVTPRMKNRERILPVGFDLSREVEGGIEGGEEGGSSSSSSSSLTIPAEELPSLRVRGRDVAKIGPLYDSALRNHWVDVAEEQDATAADTGTDSPPGRNTGDQSSLEINGVFFPLLATLLRRWHADIADKYESSSARKVKKVLILVSGVGSPRNWTHSITGNSTQACSELMEIFIKVLYPDVTVVRIHSDTNIFRYDENISFAKQELLPCVNAYRDAHARGEPYPDEVQSTVTEIAAERGPFDPDWKQSFCLAMSFADGSPARTHAIQASLRHTYRPTYYHFWQLKTFWHDGKVSDEDIEVHPFEEMETVPAMDVAKINDEQVKMVIDEMKAFRKFFLETLDENRNDIRNFWLRKTKKPVLAVLLVADPRDEGGFKLYRGTNMEVSMPTGSLCAERNVIGTALATNPGLKREDLRMVAVLAIPLAKEESSKVGFAPQIPSLPLGMDPNICSVVGSGGSSTALDKAATSASSASGSFPAGKQFLSDVQKKLEKEQHHEPIKTGGGMTRTYSSQSFSSIIEEKDESAESKDASSLSWEVAEIPEVVGGSTDAGTGDGSTSSRATAEKLAASYRPLAFHESIDLARRPSMSPPGTPLRKIKLNTSSLRPTWGGDGPKKKRTVVVHSQEDINPLRPCGACNEWLKKIAESNPYFRVLTFTDADCNGVYVTPCQE